MCIADILKTASIHSVRQKDVYPGLQRGRHGACSVSESEVIQFLTSRKYNPFREVRYLPEPSSVLEPNVGTVSGSFPEELAPEALERFFHSHSFGVSHLREICQSLLAQDMPVTSCGPGHRKQAEGNPLCQQHSLLHHCHQALQRHRQRLARREPIACRQTCWAHR